MAAVDVGGRREMLWDDALLQRIDGGARIALAHPERREVALVHDPPWEGNLSAYCSVFQDDAVCRMYYRGWHRFAPGQERGETYVCYAQSRDGVHWERPALDLVPVAGAERNNIILEGTGSDTFAAFLDGNPDADPAARYRGLGRGRGACRHQLFGFVSADGVHWSVQPPTPLELRGAFDSQNLAFWDPNVAQYRIYFRDFRDGVRDIKTAVSPDFRIWSEPQWLEYPGAPAEHLYTSQILPYPRAPHMYVGFPGRFVEQRGGMIDGLFMSSRNGVRFRRWGEAALRPGPGVERWGNRSNYIWWGLIETASDREGAPPELSIYASEAYGRGPAARTRRYVYRLDGFASLNAPLSGGEALTKPVRFSGSQLELNVATSGVGSVRVSLTDLDGKALTGFGLDDCPPIFGDDIARGVSWASGADLSRVAGQPVRLRFALADADLYSYRFVA